MKKSFHLLLFVINIPIVLFSQMNTQRALLNEDGTLTISETRTTINPNINIRMEYEQLPGFPIKKRAHPNFKNLRNVTVADIDEDGKEDILVCLNETLFAFSGEGSELWSYQLEGTANFPPAVEDIDKDGHLEVAVQTYGVPSVGNAYLFDRFGNIMEGWPLNFNNHFMLNGVTFGDLNGDGVKEIILNERVSSTLGRVHAVDILGETISDQWPVEIPGTPAFTASVGDLDNNGIMDLVTSTTSAIYAFDASGNLLNGFPVSEEGAKISYQSPLLRDLDQDGSLEIIGGRHGDLPSNYILNHDGTYFNGWPINDNLWTFAPPSVADVDGNGENEIFFGRPYFSEMVQENILLGFDQDGNFIDNFPKRGFSGSEGVIAIADVDDDGEMELITSSNIISDAKGSIRIYELEDSNEEGVESIPTEGFTYLNGGYLGDLNGDGILDLTALSYQSKFDNASPDSAFINVFDLQVPYRPDKILFNGYKGSNDHAGVKLNPASIIKEVNIESIDIFPNPTNSYLTIPETLFNANLKLELYDAKGVKLNIDQYKSQKVDLTGYPAGIYWLKMSGESNIYISKIVKI